MDPKKHIYLPLCNRNCPISLPSFCCLTSETAMISESVERISGFPLRVSSEKSFHMTVAFFLFPIYYCWKVNEWSRWIRLKFNLLQDHIISR